MAFYFDSDDLDRFTTEEEAEETSFDNQDEEEIVEGEEHELDEEIEDDNEEIDAEQYELTVKGKAVKLNQSQLEAAIDSYVNGGDTGKDEDYQIYQQTKPLMNALRKDEAMRQYVQLSQNGYKPADILWTLLDQYRPDLTHIVKTHINGGGRQQMQQEDEPPIFNTIEEETNYYIDKRLREQLTPINQTLQQFGQYQQTKQQEEALQRVGQNNDYLVAQAIEQGGYTYDANALKDAVFELYPGVDVRQLQLTPQMANRIVKVAFGDQKMNKQNTIKKTDLSAITKQSKLPNLLGGNTGKSRKNEPAPKYAPATGTKMERIKHVDDVWDKI